ncbi:MAG: hypothetical protein NTW19_15055 [Planctomycetota bacterium]|nr:hypothetical protein [Planctomycetota bacterium]
MPTRFPPRPLTLALLILAAACFPARAAETLWIEAENLQGVHGYCFPDMDQKTAGHWALSGPGIAPEWTQGGESEWLSIACGPDDAAAAATIDLEIPEAGEWRVWVRYRDWRGQTELFAVRLEQPGADKQQLTFGQKPIVDEDDELKLLWKWSFAWDQRPARLAKGPAKLTLLSMVKQQGHRQIDAICLTTDVRYQPVYKEKPVKPVWRTLAEIRVDPRVAPTPLAARAAGDKIPDAWKVRTPHDKGFVYLWNMREGQWLDDLVSKDPKRMLVPYQVDPAWLADFRAAFGGKASLADVPIFGDPRVAPVFHNAGPEILANDAFAAWLDANPARMWGLMQNYFPPKPLSAEAKARWPKYKDRYVGNIAGESLGYFRDDATFNRAGLDAAIKAAKSREEVYRGLTDICAAGIAAREKTVWGQPIDKPYQMIIPCQSVGMTSFAHACFEWGAQSVGYESISCLPGLGMRLAFLRGAARQFGGMTATYRSCGLGDAHQYFSEQNVMASPKFAYDNYYDMWSGAGMTWYKFDLWHQYFSGSGAFYHEQGFDEFWSPAGSATPRKPIQLSPKGRLVDEFLKLTREHPDRGAPFTPVAFLLDRAHGWDANPNHPSHFDLDPEANPAVLARGRHARMLLEWFQVAYDSYGPRDAQINTGVNPTFLPNLFGDVFDVLVTAPKRTDILDHYPVVVLNGEVTLTEEWGKKLAKYMDEGGTLIASAEQLTGPGVAALQLPQTGATAEEASFQWVPTTKQVVSQRFRYQPLKEGEPLIKASNGDVVAAAYKRGKGRLVYLSIPLGLGIDQAATPAVALLLAHVRQGLLPVEVRGEVEWLLNRTEKGWIITLLNPAGCTKPQHGVVPTDFTQTRTVTITASPDMHEASEWFTAESLPVAREGKAATVTITVPAAGVRIVELK